MASKALDNLNKRIAKEKELQKKTQDRKNEKVEIEKKKKELADLRAKRQPTQKRTTQKSPGSGRK